MAEANMLKLKNYILVTVNNNLTLIAGNRELFGFNIRDENKCKTVNCFQYLDKKLNFEDMLHLMTKQLKRNQTSTSKNEEDFIIRSLPSRRVSVDPIYYKKLAVKAVNSMFTESKRRKARSSSCSELRGSL